LEVAIRAVIDAHPANPNPFVWTKTADHSREQGSLSRNERSAFTPRHVFSNHVVRILIRDAVQYTAQ
jgi:hypothetical protein